MAEWIDSAASSELPVLRSRGEDQALEFMREFPSNARELAKEIAAFASTNAGMILIGVSDDGELVGIADAVDPRSRDSLVRRIEGLCNGPIQPPITPSASFAVESDHVVLVLRVPRGNQPVYYCQHVPYVRHMREARPASPVEVIERVEEWLALQPNGADPHGEFWGALIAKVRELLLWTDELDQRHVNPWLEDLKWMLTSHGSELRRLAATDTANDLDLDRRLEILADLADAAGNHQLYLGRESWTEFEGLVGEVRRAAVALKTDVIDVLEIDDRSREHAINELRQAWRELESLERRADQYIESGRIKDLQTEAANIGRTVKRLGLWGLDREPADFVGRLVQVGRNIHVLETLRMTMGGEELDNLVSGVRLGSAELRELVGQLSES